MYYLIIQSYLKFVKWCSNQESNLKYILTKDALCHLTIGAFYICCQYKSILVALYDAWTVPSVAGIYDPVTGGRFDEIFSVLFCTIRCYLCAAIVSIFDIIGDMQVVYSAEHFAIGIFWMPVVVP